MGATNIVVYDRWLSCYVFGTRVMNCPGNKKTNIILGIPHTFENLYSYILENRYSASRSFGLLKSEDLIQRGKILQYC